MYITDKVMRKILLTSAFIITLIGLAALWWFQSAESREIAAVRSLLREGKPAAALRAAQGIVSARPQSAPAAAVLSEAELVGGDLERAVATFANAQKLANDAQRPGIAGVAVLIEAERMRRAEVLKALEKRCDELRTKLESQPDAEVRAEIVKLADSHPENFRCQQNLAISLLGQRNYRRAAETMKSAAEKSSGAERETAAAFAKKAEETRATLDALRDLVEKDDYAGVVKSAEQAVLRCFPDYEIPFLAGSSQLALGKLEEAKKSLLKAKEAAPADRRPKVDEFLARVARAEEESAKNSLSAKTRQVIETDLANPDPDIAFGRIAGPYMVDAQEALRHPPFEATYYIQAAIKCAGEGEKNPRHVVHAAQLLSMLQKSYPKSPEAAQAASLAESLRPAMKRAVVAIWVALVKDSTPWRNTLRSGGKPEVGQKLDPISLAWAEPDPEEFLELLKRFFEHECLAASATKSPLRATMTLAELTDTKGLPPGSDEARIRAALIETLTSEDNAGVFVWMAENKAMQDIIADKLSCKAGIGTKPCAVCKGTGEVKLKTACTARPHETINLNWDDLSVEECDGGQFFVIKEKRGWGDYGITYHSWNKKNWEEDMKSRDAPGLNVEFKSGLYFLKYYILKCRACNGTGTRDGIYICAACKGAKQSPALVLSSGTVDPKPADGTKKAEGFVAPGPFRALRGMERLSRIPFIDPKPADGTKKAEGFVEPMAINRVKPRYPDEDRRAGNEGAVTLVLRISTKGEALDLAVKNSSGKASLDAAALEAVRQWTFSPATQDGTPIENSIQMDFVFKLEEAANTPQVSAPGAK